MKTKLSGLLALLALCPPLLAAAFGGGAPPPAPSGDRGVGSADLAAAPATHDRAFWKDLVARKYAPPEGADVKALALELSSMLGSTDAELRDDVAYTTLSVWIYKDRRLDGAALRELTAAWTGNLSAGLGESGTDSIFRRSFSALSLATVAGLDNEKGMLTQEEYDRLLAAALDYLAREKDLRDYDTAKGWMHATAHTADLLKFLARNPKLRKEQQARLVEGIASRLSSAGRVFTHGEEERLARALLSLVRRKDFDAAPLEAWLARLPAEGKAVWIGNRIDEPKYAAAQNAKGCLKSLLVFVSADASGSIPDGVKARLVETLVKL